MSEHSLIIKQELIPEATTLEVCQTARRPLILEVGLLVGEVAASAQPLLQAIAVRFGERVRLCKVDATQANELCTQFSISRVPTMLVFLHGELVYAFTHETPEQEVLAALDRIVGQCEPQQAARVTTDIHAGTAPGLPVRLEFDRNSVLEESSLSKLDLRVHNLTREPLAGVELVLESAAFSRCVCTLPLVQPDSCDILEVDVEPQKPGDPQVHVRLRGSCICEHLSELRGKFRVHVRRPGEASRQTGVTISQVNIDGRNILLDGGVHSAATQGAGASPPAPTGPNWQEVVLQQHRVDFPPTLSRAWDDFLRRHHGDAILEGCRPGSISGRKPKDSWNSRSFQKASEAQPVPFAQAPDGIYRIEFFTRDGGKFLAIAYEKQGHTFVSHWRTNDAEYAHGHPDVFGECQ